MRKSFVLYSEVYETIRHLSDLELGRLTRIIFEYVMSGKEVEPSEPLFFVFNPIKLQLDRDYATYESVREKRSVAGKISAIKREQIQQVLTSVESVKQAVTNPTDNVDVYVDDNVNNIKRRAKCVSPFVDFEGKQYFKSPELNNLFIDFLRQRKANKHNVTERALSMLVDRAKKLYKTPQEFKTALEDSIMNNWKTFYEPKSESKSNKKSVEDVYSRAWSGGKINEAS